MTQEQESIHFANLLNGSFVLNAENRTYPGNPNQINSKGYLCVYIKGEIENCNLSIKIFDTITHQFITKPVGLITGLIDKIPIHFPSQNCWITFEIDIETITDKSKEYSCDIIFELSNT